MNLTSILSCHARHRPGREAVVFEGQRLSFSALNERVNRLAQAFLAAGIVKGDKFELYGLA